MEIVPTLPIACRTQGNVRKPVTPHWVVMLDGEAAVDFVTHSHIAHHQMKRLHPIEHVVFELGLALTSAAILSGTFT